MTRTPSSCHLPPARRRRGRRHGGRARQARETTIRTLSTYLDLQGSRTRAAAALHLHPNGVGHRINKAMELLNVDLSDPETRFMLQLACRVWLISRQREPRIGEAVPPVADAVDAG